MRPNDHGPETLKGEFAQCLYTDKSKVLKIIVINNNKIQKTNIYIKSYLYLFLIILYIYIYRYKYDFIYI